MKLIKCVSFLIGLFLLVTCGTVALMWQNSTVRSAIFANVCAQMAKSVEGTRERCALLRPIRHGRVLEIGFGAGANLVCLANRTGITHYQSIEPNENFASHIDATVKRAVAASAEQRLPFPLAIDRGYAEALPYEDESFDFVFSTHVLCSVDSVPDALREIHRVLKRGGQFVFLEHVLASPDADPWRRSVQDAIEPVWAVIGDGCRFRDIASELDNELGDLMLVDYEAFDADFVPALFSFVRPHLRGIATKK